MRAVFLLAALTACGTKPSKLEVKPAVVAIDETPGLGLVLANGVQSAPHVDHHALAAAKKIDPSALFARAKPMQAVEAVPAALRPASQPPPTTGETVALAFPTAAVPPPPPTSGELHVLRFMPEGKLDLAPRLTVTFDQPMVTGQATTSPVAITPAVKGHWRWIGARTVEFDPEGKRFPMATTYRVTIPAGTKSLVGTPLAKAVEFSFETPPPKLISYAPEGEQVGLDAPMLLVFDQAVDPQTVLANLHVSETPKHPDVKDPWKSPPPIDRKVAIFDPTKDAALQERISQLGADVHWLTVRATQKFSPNSLVRVELPPGFTSQEGPNRTTEKQGYSFSTYAPFAFEVAPCSAAKACSPSSYLSFQFNNKLDEEAFKDDLVEVVPKIAKLQINVAYQHVILSGQVQPNTKYRVEFKAGLRDEHGQTLGHDVMVDTPVGAGARRFWGANGTIILDPSAAPTLDYFGSQYTGVKAQLWKVGPDDYAAFQRGAFANPKLAKPGVALPVTIKPLVAATALATAKLDLSPALANGRGSVVAIVEPSPWSSDDKNALPPRYIAWAQATHLAIDAHVDRDQLVIYASDLATGAPVQDALIELRPLSTSGRTDARGIATIARPSTRRDDEPAYLIARHGDDVTVLPGEAWGMVPRTVELVWHVFDDRALYRPGEQVSIKGWMRLRDKRDIGPATGVSSVHYTVHDSQNNAIGAGDANVNALGGFDLQFTLPNTPNLGDAEVVLEAKGMGTTTHEIRIEEFRRPEFEATAHAQTTPFVVGGAGSITVDAHYFSGSPLGGAKVNWSLHANRVNYRPPNRDDYMFGSWTPWWGTGAYDRSADKPPLRADWSFEAKTDAAGEHVLRVETPRADKPYNVSAQATITAPNNQSWSANTSFTVHPAEVYVGLAAKAPFVVQGQPYELAVLGVDIDGKVAPGAAVSVDAVRVIETWKNGKLSVQKLDPQHCAQTTTNAAQTCKLATPTAGEYSVTATIVDTKGRKNTTELTYWVAGGAPRAVESELPQQTVDVIPDKKQYVPGNTAELLVRAPFAPAEGTVTYRRSGIIKTERISFTEATKVIAVPITDDLVPNMFVQLDLVGVDKIAYAVGSVDLTVLPRERTLAVKVTPSADKLAPGDKASIAVAVTDAAGKPVVNADVAVVVVDDSVLTLAGYQFEDPIATFYRPRSSDTSDYYTRAFVQRTIQEFDRDAYGYDTWTRKNTAPGGGGYGRGGGRYSARYRVNIIDSVQEMPDPNADRDEDHDGIPDTADKMPDTAIAVRTNFNALAVFAGSVTTNAAGTANVPVTMPDNLTRYRVVAIAAAGAKQFGKGESTMTARLPLMVRATPPRFLSYGDTFSLPVTLQNQTDATMIVKLGARAQNLALADGDGREVTVPANDQVLVEIPMAARMAGTARMQLVAASGDYSDAQELSLPVWTPATTEAFATYGVIDNGAILQPVAVPPSAIASSGGIEVSTASTNLQALTDALVYLVRYPYECAEQRSSRILAIASLRDVLSAFHAKELPAPATLEASVATDVSWLVALQNSNGGFAYWNQDETPDPYLSVYVTYVLSRAKAKGYDVPARLFDQARKYLDHVELYFTPAYTRAERDSITAFAIYTRKLIGESVSPEALALAKSPQLSVDAIAWLIATLAGTPDAAPLEQRLAQHISETAGAASITSAYTHGYLVLGSDTRSAGIALDALIADQPKSDLIPKLVTGLLASKKRGRWDSTQENGFVLAALDRYFHTYESATPNFTARVWLGADYAGDHVFRGRTTETASIAIPMAEVHAGNLAIQKDGPGRLYYRIGTSYAPADLNVAAADYGFVVERAYEPVDNTGDVTRDANGVWHVKAGARVRIKLSMVNDGQRHHVALVDPLPAGFEAVNPVLAGTAKPPADPKANPYWWWTSPWYEHENMRDERVEAFAGDLWEGVHAYEYIARATTRGSFIAAAPKAEEMYAPETFGRGASERVIVE